MNRERLIGVLMPGFQGTEIPEWIKKYLSNGLRSVALYGSNIENLDQLKNLIAEIRSYAREDLLVATDEEGGDVTRLEYNRGSSFSGNRRLGKIDDFKRTALEAQEIAKICSYAGVNLNLAPVGDVNSNPLNPVIGNRSFGDNQDLVSKHLKPWVESHQAQGVACTVKHFPGHGDTMTDSHHGVSEVVGGWEKINSQHLLPFKEAIKSNVAAVMTGHLLVDSDKPSSQDPYVHKLLRELGFEGVIITDALDMKAATQDGDIASAAVSSLIAGADLLCLGPNTTESELNHILDEIEKAIEKGRLHPKDLLSSIERIESLALQYQCRENDEPPELDFEIADIDTTKPAPSRVYKLQSSSNPAVGDVPWLAIEHEVNLIGIGASDVPLQSFKDAAVLVRSQSSLDEFAANWPEDKEKKDLVIFSPGPIHNWCGFSGVDLFGSSVPHARALVKYLKG